MCPTASGGQIHRRGRPETTRANAQDFRGLQCTLPVHADLGQDQVTAVTSHFVGGQRGQLAHRLSGERRRTGPARHGRDDAHRVAGLQRRLVLLQIADVFVVDVNVDEAAHAALVVEQMLLQPGKPRRQVCKQLVDGRPVELDDVELVGIRTERCGNVDFYGHVRLVQRSVAPVAALKSRAAAITSSSSNCDRSSRSRHDRSSRGSPVAHRHNHVREKRPRVIEVVLRRLRRMIRVRMIEPEQLAAGLGCACFRGAIVLRPHEKPPPRAFFRRVGQREGFRDGSVAADQRAATLVGIRFSAVGANRPSCTASLNVIRHQLRLVSRNSRRDNVRRHPER